MLKLVKKLIYSRKFYIEISNKLFDYVDQHIKCRMKTIDYEENLLELKRSVLNNRDFITKNVYKRLTTLLQKYSYKR